MTAHVSHQDRLTPRVTAYLLNRLKTMTHLAEIANNGLKQGKRTPAQTIAHVDETLTYLETELRAEIEETMLMGDVE